MYHCIAQKQVDSQLRPDSRFLSLKKWFSSFENWEWTVLKTNFFLVVGGIY